MERYEPFASLGLALLTGLLVGLEREQSRSSGDADFFGGIRTFPLLSLLGAVAALLTPALGFAPLLVAGAGVVALTALSHRAGLAAGRGGITSEASALLTFFVGALSATPAVIATFSTRALVAAAVAVIATLLLSARTELRALTSRLSREDVLSTLKFLVLAVVLLPLLPNEPLGPYGALNPFTVGVMVTLIAGVDFAGYAAMRFLGTGRGMLLTGAVGGLASSTAVTLGAARRARESAELAQVSALAVIIASAIMQLRLLAVLWVADAGLGRALAVPLVTMAIVSGAFAAFHAFRDRAHRDASAGVKLTNPFELTSAFKFGAFFVGVLVASRWAQASFGDGGAYATGLLAGLTDVDAISLSMAHQLKAGTVSPDVAALTVLLANVANTVVKAGLSLVLGGRAMGGRVALAFGVTLLAGLGALLVVR